MRRPIHPYDVLQPKVFIELHYGGFLQTHLFQITLICTIAKWYNDQPENSHRTFYTIVKVFLTLFQLFVLHDLRIDILTTCLQTTSTHISNHIHEWCR
jgi:hypothetical protein